MSSRAPDLWATHYASTSSRGVCGPILGPGVPGESTCSRRASPSGTGNGVANRLAGADELGVVRTGADDGGAGIDAGATSGSRITGAGAVDGRFDALGASCAAVRKLEIAAMALGTPRARVDPVERASSSRSPAGWTIERSSETLSPVKSRSNTVSS
jgi:hypothetical protein